MAAVGAMNLPKKIPACKSSFLAVALCLLVCAGWAGTAERKSSEQASAENDYQRRREIMVRDQIRARGVQDEKVLRVMREVPRHLFVPPHLRAAAYQDKPLPIGNGQTISQPYMVALMTELLQPQPEDAVLEIGTGSGYQAAVVSRLARQVYSIEIVPRLGLAAERLLERLGFANVRVRIGDGYLGWPEYAPFDGILVTAAPPEIPAALTAQLKRGGRMVVPVGKAGETQKLMVLEKSETSDHIVRRTVISVRFVPMVKGKGR